MCQLLAPAKTSYSTSSGHLTNGSHILFPLYWAHISKLWSLKLDLCKDIVGSSWQGWWVASLLQQHTPSGKILFRSALCSVLGEPEADVLLRSAAKRGSGVCFSFLCCLAHAVSAQLALAKPLCHPNKNWKMPLSHSPIYFCLKPCVRIMGFGNHKDDQDPGACLSFGQGDLMTH